MDSGLALRAPRNDEFMLAAASPLLPPAAMPLRSPRRAGRGRRATELAAALALRGELVEPRREVGGVAELLAAGIRAGLALHHALLDGGIVHHRELGGAQSLYLVAQPRGFLEIQI